MKYRSPVPTKNAESAAAGAVARAKAFGHTPDCLPITCKTWTPLQYRAADPLLPMRVHWSIVFKFVFKIIRDDEARMAGRVANAPFEHGLSVQKGTVSCQDLLPPVHGGALHREGICKRCRELWSEFD